MSRTIRAKFQVDEVKNETWGSQTVKMSAVYGSSDEDNAENNQFNEATPYGELFITIDNPDAKDFFQQGDWFYLDFTRSKDQYVDTLSEEDRKLYEEHRAKQKDETKD